MEAIRSVRNIRAEVNVPMSKKVELLIKPASAETQDILTQRRIPETLLQHVHA